MYTIAPNYNITSARVNQTVSKCWIIFGKFYVSVLFLVIVLKFHPNLMNWSKFRIHLFHSSEHKFAICVRIYLKIVRRSIMCHHFSMWRTINAISLYQCCVLLAPWTWIGLYICFNIEFDIKVEAQRSYHCYAIKNVITWSCIHLHICKLISNYQMKSMPIKISFLPQKRVHIYLRRSNSVNNE